MAIGTRYHRIAQVQLVHNEVDFYLRLVFGIHHVENEQTHILLATFYQFLKRFQPFEYSDSARLGTRLGGARWYTVSHSPEGGHPQETQNLGLGPVGWTLSQDEVQTFHWQLS